MEEIRFFFSPPTCSRFKFLTPPEIELLPSTASYVILSPPAGLDPVADKTRQKCSELSVFISEIPWREVKPRRPNVSIDPLLLQRRGILMVSLQPQQCLQPGMKGNV